MDVKTHEKTIARFKISVRLSIISLVIIFGYSLVSFGVDQYTNSLIDNLSYLVLFTIGVAIVAAYVYLYKTAAILNQYGLLKIHPWRLLILTIVSNILPFVALVIFLIIWGKANQYLKTIES